MFRSALETEAISGQTHAQQAGVEDSANSHHIDGNFFDPTFSVVEGSVEVPNSPDMVDYKVNVPHKLSTNVGQLIVAGFDGYYGAYDGLQAAMASNGEISISFDTPRFGGKLNDIFNAQKLHADCIAAISQDLPNNKQLQEVQNGEQLDMTQLTLDPHSMGNLAAVRYALAHPDDVHSLRMMAGVGMDGKNALKMVPRVIRSLPIEVAGSVARGFGQYGSPVSIAKNGIGHVIRNPLRAGGEIISCSRADIRSDVEKLGNMNVKLAMITFEDDELVPSKPSQEASAHLFDYVVELGGQNHLATQTDPSAVAASLTVTRHALHNPQELQLAA